MTEPDRPAGSAAPKSPRLLARSAQGAIAVAAVVEVIRAATLRASRLDPAGTSPNTAGLVSMVSVDAMTLATALFLVWFHRCRRNARVITPGVDLGSDAWAVMAWLIPLVNAWAPRGLLLATRRASSTDPTSAGRDDTLVNAWWVAWAGHFLTGAIGSLTGSPLPLLVIAEALTLTAAALVIIVIHRMTAAQSQALHAARADVMPAA
ncbi:DUF4328 domain-containing protein [Streptomyces sp. NPDC101152]|uniref:DUF4328 domain-containing protein n=1 Tax=Streptomyces sp. NPDC101152 TaxID=3366116 RepID=UPI003813336C